MRETAIEMAWTHLDAAIRQSLSSDDQIIMNHVRAAYEILAVVRDADRALARAKWDTSQPGAGTRKEEQGP